MHQCQFLCGYKIQIQIFNCQISPGLTQPVNRVAPPLFSIRSSNSFFFKNVGVEPRKAAKFENPVKFFLKCRFWSITAKLENVGTKIFLQIYKILSNFDSNSLICYPTLFPGKSSSNIAKSNNTFPGKRRGDRALILTYLVSPLAEVSLPIFFNFGHLQGKQVVKAGRKMKTLGESLFHENLNPSNIFRTMFLFIRALPLVRISVILEYIWGSKDPKTSQKGPFHRCWIDTQNIENF